MSFLLTIGAFDLQLKLFAYAEPYSAMCVWASKRTVNKKAHCKPKKLQLQADRLQL